MPETSIPAGGIGPQDVPAELVEALLSAANLVCVEMPRFEARRILAAVLPMAYRRWHTELMGGAAELAEQAEPRTPDDTVRLCEMARPGEHVQRAREQIAREIESVVVLARKDQRPGEAKAEAYQHAARIARGGDR